jgi:hypothetical protein
MYYFLFSGVFILPKQCINGDQSPLGLDPKSNVNCYARKLNSSPALGPKQRVINSKSPTQTPCQKNVQSSRGRPAASKNEEKILTPRQELLQRSRPQEGGLVLRVPRGQIPGPSAGHYASRPETCLLRNQPLRSIETAFNHQYLPSSSTALLITRSFS